MFKFVIIMTLVYGSGSHGELFGTSMKAYQTEEACRAAMEQEIQMVAKNVTEEKNVDSIEVNHSQCFFSTHATTVGDPI